MRGGRLAGDLVSERSDAVWSARGTTPDAIEAAFRELLSERHAEHGGYVPARALNMVAFVDDRYSGEIANRLRQVGRYHASRLVVLAHDPRRQRLDARVTVASEEPPLPGQLTLLRETAIVQIGDHHLDDLVTIVDPLVVSDLPTLLWSPHGHPEAVDALLTLAQAILIDSVDEPDCREAVDRASALTRRAYIVDLAWLRSTPWRERLAGAFDRPPRRAELAQISSLRVTHHPASTIAAVLLVGWLASRLRWTLGQLHEQNGSLLGSARCHDQTIALDLRPDPRLTVRGLSGAHIQTNGGLRLSLERGSGGLSAHRSRPGHPAQSWTVLGASRGEGGILGEGIRQALLRDPTYIPALAAARTLIS